MVRTVPYRVSEAENQQRLDAAYFDAVYTCTDLGFAFTFAPTGAASHTPPGVCGGEWAMITPFNPGSVPLPIEENLRRHSQLRLDAERAGLPMHEAVFSDRQGRWRERGWLLENIGREKALGLARRYGQRAVVFATAERIGLLFPATERWLIAPVQPFDLPKP